MGTSRVLVTKACEGDGDHVCFREVLGEVRMERGACKSLEGCPGCEPSTAPCSSSAALACCLLQRAGRLFPALPCRHGVAQCAEHTGGRAHHLQGCEAGTAAPEGKVLHLFILN